MLACISCKPAAPGKPAATASAPVPQLRATVVTIKTTIQPGNNTLTHTLVIANGRVRSDDELDRWRLFDVDHDQVTFVDDVAKTYRTMPMTMLVRDRLGAVNDALPPTLPRAQFVATKTTRAIAGVNATQSIVKLGGYTHELWIGTHPAIPPKLFAMMVASRPPSSPAEPVMKMVDEALMKMTGFPLAEHSELPYGNKKMVVDKEVVSVEQRNVPQSMLNVRADYRDVTPK